MSFIVDISNYKELNIGNKARNLFFMRENGINVPDLFCINSECFITHSDSINTLLQKIDFSNEESILNCSAKIQELIEKLNLDTQLAETISTYIDKSLEKTEFFSVRSSSFAEDSKNNSFAGQLDTFLFVDRESLPKSAVRCFKSLYSANVLKYCHHQGIPFSSLGMSVIVQEMIDSDLSGIIFSANPQGILNESVIVTGKGTGDGVVEEKVPTTTYYYNRTDSIYYYEQQKNAPLIDHETIESLIRGCKHLQDLFGDFLDIEFSIKDNNIYFLQSRPITTLINTDNPLILDNSNIVESYPGITLPLTDSFIQEAYYRVFKGVAYRCLGNKKLVQKYESVFMNMVGSANGRIYYKISNWYTIIRFLPFSRKIIPIWQDMMGVSSKEHHEKDNNLSLFYKFKTYLNALHEALHIPKNMNKLNRQFTYVSEKFIKTYCPELNNEELSKLYDDIANLVLEDWDITLLNDMYSFVFTGLLKHKFKQIGLQNSEHEINKYISGIYNIESMKPIRALVSLAVLAVEKNVLPELLLIKNDDMAVQYFKDNNSEFAVRFMQYIDIYGDRVLEELKLETKTFRVSPFLLIQKILEYSKDKTKLYEIFKAFNSNSNETSDYIMNKCGWLDKKAVKYLSRHAMLGISNREISRLNRSRIYGMVRSIFLSIGNNFYSQNRLDSPKDIFYLYAYEVFKDIRNPSADFKALVKKRKAAYEIYRQLPAYSRIVFADKEFNKMHTSINSVIITGSRNGTITGTPCANGIATAEVIVVDNPKEINNVQDKILVAKMTDPGWVFMLTLSKGIITEKGSLLSHTAIISRELKIPSIVGVKNITNILKSGDIVRMNGNTGEIDIVGEKNVQSN